MSIYWRAALFAVCFLLVPSGLVAQTDVCSNLPFVANSASGVTGEVIVEQMRQRAAVQTAQESIRSSWVVQLFPVKYLDTSENLKALCIFSAEIVPQPTLHMISVRASKESIAAIGDAIKRLDVQQTGPKSVELTIHVLVASDQDETLRPFPPTLKPVVDQLKGVLSYKQFFLLDTMIGTTIDTRRVSLNGDVRGLNPTPPGQTIRDTGYQFYADLRIGSGEPATASVRLSNLRFSLANGMRIDTDVDVPQGKQVVVGKTSVGDRAFILVVSAKILN